jgi:hypothetical protein
VYEKSFPNWPTFTFDWFSIVSFRLELVRDES